MERLGVTIRIPAFLLCLVAMLLGCTAPEPASKVNLGYLLPLEEGFRINPSYHDGRLYRVDYLKGESISLPRLVVQILPRELSLEEHLDEALLPWAGMEIRGERVVEGLQAINAVGIHLRQAGRPFPEQIPDFEQLLDLRVFLVGDWVYVFTWTQPPDDEAALQPYLEAMERLRFTEAPGSEREQP